jgi:hypothetical protein
MTEGGEKNYMDEIHDDAIKNLAGQKVKMQNYTFFGEFEYIPVPLEKQKSINDAVDDINQIVKPTISRLEHPTNIAEIQDRIYRKINGYENAFNGCIMASKDLRDVNFCSDRFINQLKNDVRGFTIDVLKEY